MRLLPVMAILALLAVPAAQAAINQPTRLDDEVRFADGFDDGLFVVSGSLEARLPDARGGAAYEVTDGLSVTNLAQVCWQERQGPLRGGECATSTTSSLSLVVAKGGSVGMKLPVAVEASLSAPHALALFSDIRGAFSPIARQQLGFDKAIGAALLDPVVTVEPRGGVIDATLVTLSATTIVDVLDGGSVIHRIQGDDEIVTFDGIPRIGSFSAETVFMPFRTGSVAQFAPADDQSAAAGLEWSRLLGLLGDSGDPNQLEELHSRLGESLEDVLNGAMFGFPVFAPGGGSDTFSLIRFDSLVASPANGNLRLEGDAPLMLQGSRVGGSAPLLGVAWLALPWWSYALWAVALSLLTARLAVRPAKVKPQRRAMGWAAGFAVFATIMVLWDLEVRSLWGASVGTSGSSEPAGLLMFLVVQLYPLAYGLFAVAAPLRTILVNGLRLAGQGGLTTWAGPAANVLAFVPVVLLYRTYLGELLVQLGDALG